NKLYQRIRELGGVTTLLSVHALPGRNDFPCLVGVVVNGWLGVGRRVVAEEFGAEESRLNEHRPDPKRGDLWRERFHPSFDTEFRRGIRRAEHLSGDTGR